EQGRREAVHRGPVRGAGGHERGDDRRLPGRDRHVDREELRCGDAGTCVDAGGRREGGRAPDDAARGRPADRRRGGSRSLPRPYRPRREGPRHAVAPLAEASDRDDREEDGVADPLTVGSPITGGWTPVRTEGGTAMERS